VGDRLGTIQDPGKIDLDRRYPQAVLGRCARQIGNASRSDRRLRGRAAEVDAGAAQVLALGQPDFPARGGERPGEGNTTLAAAYDQRIIMFRHRYSPGPTICAWRKLTLESAIPRPVESSARGRQPRAGSAAS